MELPAGEVELTEAENELYDRQIRLWGVEIQKRLRVAKVLVSGLGGLGAEVTKNIILSGVNSVTLHDDKILSEDDFSSQFLAPYSSLGVNRAVASIENAKKLNPMVYINADTELLSNKKADFFAKFDVVLINEATSAELLRINKICREHQVKFFAGDVWGMFGYCFADLQEHTFVENTVKHKVISKPHEKIKTEVVTTAVQRSLSFPPYSDILQFDVNTASFCKKLKRTGPAFILLRILQKFRDKFGRNPGYKLRETDITELENICNDFANVFEVPKSSLINVFSQISPAAAITGGVIAQEIIKAISRNEAPHCNVFLFDPDTCNGFVETVKVN